MHIFNEKLGCYEDLQLDISCAPSYKERNGIYKSDGEFGVKYLAYNSFALLYIPTGATIHIAGRYPREWTTDRRKFHGINQKKRASIALVLSIVQLGISRDSAGAETITLHDMITGTSSYDHTFSYKIMHVVRPYDPFDCQDSECSTGIHYYSRFASNSGCNVIRTYIQHWADDMIKRYYTKEKCEKMFKERLEHEGQ